MANFEQFTVGEDNLLPFLSPTSEGTNWYDPPPEGVVTDRGVGRVLLQFHQLAEYADLVHSKFQDIKFLDIGTGNGMLPNLVADCLGASTAIGLDPYEDGEHKTSWAKQTRETLFDAVSSKISGKSLDFDSYKHLLAYEEFFKRPNAVKLRPQAANWKFEKCFLEEYEPENKFNLLFAKCIDHIHNWDTLFQSAANITETGGLLVIKHNSFFSFNGAHRYASTFIPWGHVLLTEKQYESYAHEFHATRADSMLDFYYQGLSYERKTLSKLLETLIDTGWNVLSVEKSIAKNNSKKIALAGGVEKLMGDALRRYPDIALDELMSGRLIIVAERS